MKKVLFTLVSVFVYSLLPAQDYYLNNSGDTIRGAVKNYREWSKNPAAINFTPISGNEIILTANNCKEVIIDNSDKYIGYTGQRIINPEAISADNAAAGDVAIKKVDINIFLREIYRYKNFQLYKLYDGNRNNFYLKVDDQLSELEYYEYLSSDNHATKHDLYKTTILKALLNKNIPDLNERINELTYSELALVNFFAKTFGDANNASAKKRNKYPTEYFVGGGITSGFSSLREIIAGTNTEIISIKKTTINPHIVVGLRIYSQRNFGKLFFQPELSYMPANIKFAEKEGVYYNIKYSLISLYLCPGYTFIKQDQLEMYGSLGAGTIFIISYKDKLTNGNTTMQGKDNVFNNISGKAEVGLLLNHKLNIALTASSPLKIPFHASSVFTYRSMQVGLSGRYIF